MMNAIGFAELREFSDRELRSVVGYQGSPAGLPPRRCAPACQWLLLLWWTASPLQKENWKMHPPPATTWSTQNGPAKSACTLSHGCFGEGQETRSSWGPPGSPGTTHTCVRGLGMSSDMPSQKQYFLANCFVLTRPQ